MATRLFDSPQKPIVISTMAPFIFPLIIAIVTGNPFLIFFFLHILYWMASGATAHFLSIDLPISFQNSDAFVLFSLVPLLGLMPLFFLFYRIRLAERRVAIYLSFTTGLITIQLVGLIFFLLFGWGVSQSGF